MTSHPLIVEWPLRNPGSMSIAGRLVRRLHRSTKEPTMRGLITEKDLDQAEVEFPGIARFFESLPTKPGTFLELVARFERWVAPAPQPVRAAS